MNHHNVQITSATSVVKYNILQKSIPIANTNPFFSIICSDRTVKMMFYYTEM